LRTHGEVESMMSVNVVVVHRVDAVSAGHLTRTVPAGLQGTAPSVERTAVDRREEAQDEPGQRAKAEDLGRQR